MKEPQAPLTLTSRARRSNVKMSMELLHPSDDALFEAARRMEIGDAEQKLLQ